MTDPQNDSQLTGMAKFREIASEAIRFWERMRLVYCGVLAAIVVFYFIKGMPASLEKVNADFILVLFLLAVIANVLYCTAYIPDVFIQNAGFRHARQRVRWVLFAIGMVFAAIVTRFMMMGIFNPK